MYFSIFYLKKIYDSTDVVLNIFINIIVNIFF